MNLDHGTGNRVLEICEKVSVLDPDTKRSVKIKQPIFMPGKTLPVINAEADEKLLSNVNRNFPLNSTQQSATLCFYAMQNNR